MRLLLLSILICFCCLSDIVCQVPTKGLVAYYPFNGNANDESGNGNNGSVSGATLTEDRNGNENCAYHFDGSNDYIKVEDSEDLRMTDSLTISVWIKTSGTIDFSGIVNKIPVWEPRTGYLLYTNSDEYATFGVYYDHEYRDQYETVNCGYSVLDNQWHHLVATYDGTSLKLYVDCVLCDEEEYSVGGMYNTEPLYIGFDPYTLHSVQDRYFNGDIDDVMIYNRALDVSEIMELCENNYMLSISGEEEVCQGNSESYTVTSIEDAVSYSWSYSGTGMTISGTGNIITTSFTADATSGYLSVEVELSDGTILLSDIYYIEVDELPGDSGEITGGVEVCTGENNVEYSVSEIENATSYVWTYSGEGATIVDDFNLATVSFSDNSTSGSLSVYGINGCGAGGINTLDITVQSEPVAPGVTTGENEVCSGENGLSYSVVDESGAGDYYWSYSGEGMTILGSSNEIDANFGSDATSGYLSVYEYNDCGAGDTSTMYITVNECFGGDDIQESTKLKIPNSFSPNGDNINDVFVIGGLSENTSVTILNRFGKKLYETNNYQNNWGGIDEDGNILSTDTYWYVIKIPGTPSAFKGFVYLKR